MATITLELEIPDDQVDRVYNAFCRCHGWEDTITEIDEATGEESEVPNPQPQTEHFRETILRILRAAVIDHEVREAVNDARTTAMTEAQSVDIN
jgi:hypothetical protein